MKPQILQVGTCIFQIEVVMFQAYKVEVKEPPQGMTPPTQSVVKKAPHQPSRLRKFVAKNSAGLRIRAHPSLQSEQIGIVHVNGTIAFIDEVNRLSCFALCYSYILKHCGILFYVNRERIALHAQC
jgi:hypothetical protein